MDIVPKPITATQTSITYSPTNIIVGQTVTFTVIMSGSTGSKPIKIWHSWPGGIGQDGTFELVNGVYNFNQAFGSKGERVYHAEFAVDRFR